MSHHAHAKTQFYSPLVPPYDENTLINSSSHLVASLLPNGPPPRLRITSTRGPRRAPPAQRCPFSAHSVSASGTHTPAEHYLHPHHTASHGHGGYHAAPSRLGPSRSTSSSTPSPASSAQASAHPSPRVGGSPVTAPALATVPALDPLPPAVLPAAEPAPATSEKVAEKLNRPPITPLQPNTGASNAATTGFGATADGGRARSASDSQGASAGAMSAHASGASTPRAKFLETLQSKRAWDALIHGSFS